MKRKVLGKTFSERVVEMALSVPRGRVTTYGDLARAAGGTPMTAQSISGILGKAEAAGVKGIPWHRIVYSDGRVWLPEENPSERLALYKKEKIKLDEKNRVIDFDLKRF
ncbi:MAG: MGMT family protein [Candidatus Magasanikbacteria bacterium]|nr:MGMT family protein [Candidatus Magasanikbacteria bacterium]